MKLRSLSFFAITLLAATPVSAGDLRTAPSAVLELFTSQGCSSCPPADALLTELGEREDVIALAYHVDYWDYIGWRDTFGNPAFSDYQREYAAARGKLRIYTPQLVVNGTSELVGSRRADVTASLSDAVLLPIPLTLDEQGDMIAVSAEGNKDFPEAQLWLVTFKSKASVAVRSGENAERTLDYSNIVTSRQIIGMWDPTDGVSVKLPVADMLGSMSDGAAILIQQDKDGKPGRILGGASFVR
jgi:hypothetical protein